MWAAFVVAAAVACAAASGEAPFVVDHRASIAPTTPRLLVVGYSPASARNRSAADSVRAALGRALRAGDVYVMERRLVDALLTPWPLAETDSFTLGDFIALGQTAAAESVLDVQATPDGEQIRLRGRLFRTEASAFPVLVIEVSGQDIGAAAGMLTRRVLADSGEFAVHRNSPTMTLRRQRTRQDRPP